MDFRTERYSAGLSLNDVARLTGFTKSHVAAVENGRSNPSDQYKEAFLRAISSENQDSIITQKPVVKLLAEMAVISRQAEEQNDKLRDASKAITSIYKLNKQLIDMVAALSQRQQQEQFNIFRKNANIKDDMEASKAAAAYMVEATLEATKYWNLQKYDHKFQREVLEYIIEQVFQRLNPNVDD